MVAQADKTRTGKNTTNETEKNNDSSTLHVNYIEWTYILQRSYYS